MFFIIFVITVAIYVFHNYLFNDKNGKLFNQIPGPKTLPIFGNGLDFLDGPVRSFYYLRELSNNYNGLFRIWELNHKHINISNPEYIGLVLSSQKHLKKSRVYSFFHPWMKDGLVTSSGNKWQQRRKMLAPAFHFNILKEFSNIFVEQSNKLVEKLKETNGEVVNLRPFIADFAFYSICETSMGTNLDFIQNKFEEYKQGIYAMGEYFVHRLFRIWLHPDLMFKFSSTGKKQSKVLKTMHDFTANVIRERRNENILSGKKFVAEDMTEENTKGLKKRLALIDLLLSAESENKIDGFGIKEEVDTFMFGGHDTVATSTTFCLMLLANNLEAQNIAFEEINSILVDPSKKITIHDLNNMDYLKRCIKESLRLYPSIPFIGRETAEDIQMGDFIIPAGSSCNIHIFDLHRDPKIYPNPLKFDPDRFLAENCVKRHAFAYIPFSDGPRYCIGQKFAILEQKAVISSILRNFVLEPVTTPDDICFTFDILLRTRDPIKIKFIPRSQKLG